MTHASSTGPIALALVEDRAAVRDLLTERFQFFGEVALTLVAGSAEAFFEQLAACESLPHVVLMDIELPGTDGITATRRLKAEHPEVEVLMLTVFEDADRIFAAVRAGASGYLLKGERAERIVEAIQEIASGGAPVSPLVAKKLLGYVRGPETGPAIQVTERERDVLRLVVDGLTEHAIAGELFISPHTVRCHLKNLYKKLHVHCRAELVRSTYENRLLG